MPNFRRLLSRRWLLAFLGGTGLMFGLAMLHPYPRQSLFGPSIHGKPWCTWEAAIRRRVQREKPFVPTFFDRVFDWIHVEEFDGDTLNDPDFLPLLASLGEDRDFEVRGHVLAWVWRGDNLHGPLGMQILKRGLSDDYSHNRITSAMALWEIARDRQAIDVMVAEMKDAGLPRYTIVEYFCEVCDENAEYCHHLVPLLDDADPRIRSQAIRRLHGMGLKALPILVKGLEDRDAEVRKNATWALSILGPDAKPAIPALERRLADNDNVVRHYAGLALKQIDPVRFRNLALEPRE